IHDGVRSRPGLHSRYGLHRFRQEGRAGIAAPAAAEPYPWRARGGRGLRQRRLGAGKVSERVYDGLGIDISAHMIRLARRQAPAAKSQVGSFLSVELPPCDAVTSIGECVNYAFDRRSGKKGLAEFFHRVHGALRPGGVFVFDIVEPGVVAEGTKQRRFLEGPDWAILLEVREDRRRKTLTRQIASFRRMGKLYRRSEE